MQAAGASGVRLQVAPVVAAELVWVLSSVYRQERVDIAFALRTLLAASFMEFIDRPAVMAAVVNYESGRADFADYLIAASVERQGHSPLYSFDKRLIKERLAVAP